MSKVLNVATYCTTPVHTLYHMHLHACRSYKVLKHMVDLTFNIQLGWFRVDLSLIVGGSAAVVSSVLR